MTLLNITLICLILNQKFRSDNENTYIARVPIPWIQNSPTDTAI